MLSVFIIVHGWYARSLVKPKPVPCEPMPSGRLVLNHERVRTAEKEVNNILFTEMHFLLIFYTTFRRCEIINKS